MYLLSHIKECIKTFSTIPFEWQENVRTLFEIIAKWQENLRKKCQQVIKSLNISTTFNTGQSGIKHLIGY
jgi:hypothetical protein